MCVRSLIKLGGAGAVRAERGWSAPSEVERWEGEDPEQTGEASAGSGLQTVGLGSWRPRKTGQTAHSNSFDFWRDCDRSLTEENSVAELLRPPQHLSHGERLSQVSRACKETCLSKGESSQYLGGIPQVSECLCGRLGMGYLTLAPKPFHSPNFPYSCLPNSDQ